MEMEKFRVDKGSKAVKENETVGRSGGAVVSYIPGHKSLIKVFFF